MELPDLKHDYNWAVVSAFQEGPRREVTLFIKLWQADNQNRGIGPVIPVRFGGVTNFEEVKYFFEAIAASGNRHENIEYFNYDSAATSKPGKLCIKIMFDRTGETITIQCSSISVGDMP